MSTARKLKKAAGGAPPIPLATDLDGANDYLSRASNFSGAADSKTVTLSFWIYPNDNSSEAIIWGLGTGTPLRVDFDNNNRVNVIAANSVGTTILNMHTGSNSIPVETFTSVIISFDLANASNRYVAINDEIITATWSTYTNDSIGFAGATSWGAGAQPGGGDSFNGRITDLFKDYTFRDLSMAANRRLFTTIDSEMGLITVGGDSLATLTPIVLAFTDPDDPTLNQGTGGAWTANGVMDRSQRGANQFNASATQFDGVSEYLNKASNITGISNGKVITGAFSFSGDDIGTNNSIFRITNSGSERLRVRVTGGNGIDISALTPAISGALAVETGAGTVTQGATTHVAFSFDLTDTGKRHLHINGVEQNPTYGTYNNTDMELATNPVRIASSNAGAAEYEGNIGEFYFGTEFIDLSSSNPFFDTETSRPKYLGEMGEIPTGSQPLIYMPMRGDSPEKNKGSGGDFTEVGGPVAGSRGYSEYWARSSSFDASSEALRRIGAFNGTGARGVATLMFSFARDATIGTRTLFVQTNTAVTQFRGFQITTSGTTLDIEAYNNSNVKILDVNQTSAFTSAGEWVNVMLWFDLTNASNRGLVINNAVKAPSWTTYTNDTFDISTSDQNTYLGVQQLGFSEFDGDIGNFIWWDQYIDLSAEADRLKYFDGLGNPIDIISAIDSGDIAQPMLYLRMDDTGDLGLDSSTNSNDFTMEGTVSAGVDVNG